MRPPAADLEQAQLVSWFAEGCRRAASLGRPVLVSVAWPLQTPPDPLAFFAAAKRWDMRSFWARPNDGFWMVGSGAAAVLKANGERPIETIQQSLASLLDSAIIKGAERRGIGPMVTGGVRFDPLADRRPLWAGFPDAGLVLPRLLFTLSKEGAWLTANLLVSPETDPRRETDRTTTMIEALTSAVFQAEPQPRTLLDSADGYSRWKEWLEQALRLIEDGGLSKVVLARRRNLLGDGDFSPLTALERLVDSYPQCTVFAMDNGVSTFLGATPEELVRLQKGALALSCLAGTAPRGNTPEEDERLGRELLASDKERREHQAVVSMMAEALSNACSEIHWNREPDVAYLRNVQHLRTSFHGRLSSNRGILHMVQLLHPTPALGGTPTGAALELIRRLEGDRGWYAAPLGWLDHEGDGEFSVAIRSALLQGDQATLFAGGGIVEGSDIRREFEETELKFQPLLRALGEG